MPRVLLQLDIETRKDSNRANERKQERVVKKQKREKKKMPEKFDNCTSGRKALVSRARIRSRSEREGTRESGEKMLRQYIAKYNEWNVFRLILASREIQAIKAIYSVWIRGANAAEAEETE